MVRQATNLAEETTMKDPLLLLIILPCVALAQLFVARAAWEMYIAHRRSPKSPVSSTGIPPGSSGSKSAVRRAIHLNSGLVK